MGVYLSRYVHVYLDVRFGCVGQQRLVVLFGGWLRSGAIFLKAGVLSFLAQVFCGAFVTICISTTPAEV
jgi:hypothetical protein